MRAWLRGERNQVLRSLTDRNTYYFVPLAQYLGDGVSSVRGKKIDVSSSVVPLICHELLGMLDYLMQNIKHTPRTLALIEARRQAVIERMTGTRPRAKRKKKT